MYCTLHTSLFSKKGLVLSPRGTHVISLNPKYLAIEVQNPSDINFPCLCDSLLYNLLSFCREKRWILAVKSSFFDDGGLTGGQCLIV